MAAVAWHADANRPATMAGPAAGPAPVPTVALPPPASAPAAPAKSPPQHVSNSARRIISPGWRKYGQKTVRNLPGPVSYFRCAVHHCPARKRVIGTGPNASAVFVDAHNHPLDMLEDPGVSPAAHPPAIVPPALRPPAGVLRPAASAVPAAPMVARQPGVLAPTGAHGNVPYDEWQSHSMSLWLASYMQMTMGTPYGLPPAAHPAAHPAAYGYAPAPPPAAYAPHPQHHHPQAAHHLQALAAASAAAAAAAAAAAPPPPRPVAGTPAADPQRTAPSNGAVGVGWAGAPPSLPFSPGMLRIEQRPVGAPDPTGYQRPPPPAMVTQPVPLVAAAAPAPR